MNAGLKIIQTTAYTLHELSSPTGLVVREYVSSAGKIFGIAWQGPTPPDLQQLLGSYFQKYQQAAQAQNHRGGHAPLVIQGPDLVVTLQGHMRAFSGHAYLPDQLPEGVHAEDIR